MYIHGIADLQIGWLRVDLTQGHGNFEVVLPPKVKIVLGGATFVALDVW